MGSSLGPTLANVIMTELEKHVVTKLFDDGIIKFYIRFVDDTLVLAKNLLTLRKSLQNLINSTKTLSLQWILSMMVTFTSLISRLTEPKLMFTSNRHTLVSIAVIPANRPGD